jgi:hypothetical protein
MIQNGKVPQFLSNEIITETFDSVELRPCIAEHKDGFSDEYKIYRLSQENYTLFDLM